MTDRSIELRTTSDGLLRDLEALFVLEEEKRTLPASDARTVELAKRIHEIAGRVLGASGRQHALTKTLSESAGTAPAIEDVPRSPASILAEWRDVERRLQAAAPESAELAELEVLATRIRGEYRRAFDVAAEPPSAREPGAAVDASRSLEFGGALE